VRGKENQNKKKTDLAFGTVFGIGQYFQRSKQKLTSARQAKKLNIISACIKKYWFNCIGLLKKYI
jgi:hypothetical protein